MVIHDYFMNGYLRLFYEWLFVAILSMAICGYSINGYLCILSMAIGCYFINDYGGYSINDC
jgi:hypothetical protein